MSDSLQARLDRIKAGFSAKVPAPAKAIMTRATADLRSSGILARLPPVGSALTPFALPDTRGQTRAAGDYLARGPLVVSFYRGLW